MGKTSDKARDHLRRALAALLSVALATGGPWQTALAQDLQLLEDGEPVIVVQDDPASGDGLPEGLIVLDEAPPDLVVAPEEEEALAEEPVLVAQGSDIAYYDPTEVTGDKNKIAQNCNVLNSWYTPNTFSEGWWALGKSLKYSRRVTISGNVNLILRNNATLTCYDGIYVPKGSSLTIWAPTDGDPRSQLVVTASRYNAGIGAVQGEDAGTITINGGDIKVEGGTRAAGIGGADNANAGPVIINGGRVDARGGNQGAGIGGGYGANSDTVTIRGGEVTAYGSNGGAGIGAGNKSDCKKDITIENATVTAFGDYEGSVSDATCSAGIGAGAGEDLECTVTITNSTVTARSCFAAVTNVGGFYGGAGIGGGAKGNARNGKVYITDSRVTALGSNGGAGIGGGREDSGIGGEGPGLVEIKGLKSVVVAQGDGRLCSAIGHGNDDSFMGNLTIDPGLKVQAGNKGTEYERLFMYGVGGLDERAAACQYRLCARIEACDHPGVAFDSVDQDYHKRRDCPYCGTTFQKEEHNLDGAEGACTVCGHKGDVFMLSFEDGGAQGAMRSVYVAQGKSIELPDYGPDVPEDKVFAGWKIGDKTYAAGDPYTPTADVTVVALWTQVLATISFDANGATGTMEPAQVAKGEKYPLPGCGFVPAEGAQMHFVGWKVGNGTQTRQPFERIDVTGDVTITAQWRRYWLVTFEDGDGTYKVLEVNDGEKAKELEAPTKDGKKFLNWQLDGAPYDFAQPVTGNITLVAAWKKAPELKSHSLTLSGAIGVDYFMDLSSLDDATRQASYMEFAVGEGAKQATYTASFDAGFTDAGGRGYYGFSCPTSSVQMADAIAATFHYGDEELKLPDYSVKDYIKAVDKYQRDNEGTSSAFSDKTVALIHAIADYGHFAQPYLSAENGWEMGTDYARMDQFYTDSYEADLAGIKSALAASAVTKFVEGTPVASATMRLRLDSGTSVEALLSPAEAASFSAADVAAVTGSFPGRETTVRLLPDGRISVRVDGVSAHLLATPLVVSYGGREVLRLSALSFANVVVSGSGSTAAARDAMCALYRYYEAAAAYRR